MSATRPALPAYLQDHLIRGAAVLPGAWFVAQCLQHSASVGRVDFTAIHLLQGDEQAAPQLDHAPGGVVLRTEAQGLATAQPGVDASSLPAALRAPDAGIAALDARSVYERLARQGNDYARRFRAVDALRAKDGRASADYVAAEGATPDEAQVVLLDALTHVAAFAGEFTGTYFLAGIGSVQRAQSHDWATGRPRIVMHRVSTAADSSLFDGQVQNASGAVVLQVTGLELRRFAEPAGAAAERVAVAGTFTLDPLDDVVEFWGRQLGTPLGLSRADYGQVFQPLLADNPVFDDSTPLHTCLVRVADWAPRHEAHAVPTRAALDAALGSLDSFLMPDGRTIASLNRYESAYLYQEIYRDLAYRRHGVRVLEGDTVIDIGANIGLFTLFAAGEAPNVTIVSVEPSPVVLPILKANAALYAPGGTIIEAGASDAIGTARFTAYRNSSVFSSFDADEGADEEAIRQVIRNSLDALGEQDEALLESAVQEMIEGRMDAEEFDCPLISVSDIIRQQGLERIDLLKIDAEKSEDAILAGIDDEHWAMIDQLIIEVHLQGGRSDRAIIEMLERHGFVVVRDEEELLTDSGLIGLYAARPARFERNAAASDEPALSTSADLFIEAAGTHAKRSSVPLDVILCPADVRDPDVVAMHERIESRLQAELGKLPLVSVMPWPEFAAHYPVDNPHDTLGGTLADMPYTLEWYASTGSALARRHMATRRPPAKVLVLDCDNTLWGGVVGEDGVQGLRIGPEHQALHASIRRLIGQGVVFALASKNAEDDVRQVFASRDDLALSWEDVVSHRVNWRNKADSLIEMAAELELGLDAFVFLDDSALECAEMRHRLPEVATLQMPEEAAAFGRFLDHAWVFDQLRTTDEDAQRARRYRDESRRRSFKGEAGSLGDFVDGLALDVGFAPIDADTLERASQMTQRTNQFNFTTVRRSVAELSDWLAAASSGPSTGPSTSTSTSTSTDAGQVLRVADRFGDYGTTGLVLYETAGSALEVDTFLLSCRVLGRGVEHRVIAELGAEAERRGLQSVQLRFQPSARNEPALKFLERLPGSRNVQADGGIVLTIPAADAAGYRYDPQSIDAAASAVAEAARSRAALPAAPSEQIERIARELASAEAVAAAVRVRTRVPRPALQTVFRAPASGTEAALAGIWQELLALDGIGADDGFFELGGSSLGAVQMVAQVQRRLGLSLSVVDVFDAPTIAALCRKLEGGDASTAADARQRGAERRAQRPVRPARRGRS